MGPNFHGLNGNRYERQKYFYMGQRRDRRYYQQNMMYNNQYQAVNHPNLMPLNQFVTQRF